MSGYFPSYLSADCVAKMHSYCSGSGNSLDGREHRTFLSYSDADCSCDCHKGW